MLKKAYFWKKN